MHDRLVWKFGGTSVGDTHRLRAVARRLVDAQRRGLQVVAVLSAMGDTTDDLVRLAYEMSPQPQPRELDALLALGECQSCALAALVVHAMGGRAVSLSGAQAGMLTDASHGNARLREVNPQRVVEALDDGAIVLVTGFQGVSHAGDITTLGRGGSDATAIALAAALGVGRCDIFTDVTGVFTADPRIVPNARQIRALTFEEMLELAEAGARVLQLRAVELAAAHGIEIHVRSTFSAERGTLIVRKDNQMFEETRVAGIAHRGYDPVYTVKHLSLATVSSALARRGTGVGAIIREGERVRFTAPGAGRADVLAALAVLGADADVQDDLGSVTVVSSAFGSRPELTASILAALEDSGIESHLVTSTASRVSCHVAAPVVDRAARVLHELFELGVDTAPALSLAS
jgi:aspartate kinase